MDYEKKYKEALELARDYYKANLKLHKADENAILEDIFPELAESEDERIRKALIDYFDDANKTDENPLQSYGIHTNKVIAWLEKQGEQKPIIIDIDKMVYEFAHTEVKDYGMPAMIEVDAYRKGINAALCLLLEYGAQFNYIHKHWYESEYYLKEKQGEQKPTSDTRYEVKVGGSLSVNGKPFDYEHASITQKDFAPKVEPKFKVGDRVNKNDREDEEHCILTITSVNIDEHCYACNQCSVIDFGEQDLWHIVEQKPAWSEEDKKYLRRAINATRNGYPETNNWLKSLKERVLPQPKQEWSVEDEIGLADAMWAIGQAGTIAKDENDMGNLWYAERWLKTLKERMGG